jgi:transcription elongation factor Elf1
MVKCPNCNTEVAEPDKSLKNQVFNIEAYTCKNCKHKFKVIIEIVFSTEILSIH